MMGNIGNQMFIYAFARRLQLEYKQDLTLDLSGLKRGYYSANYKLDCLNIPDDINYDIKKLDFWSRQKYRVTSHIYHIEYGVIQRLRADLIVPLSVCKRWFRRGCFYNVNRPFFDYPHSNRKNLFAYGYFQSEKYFEKYKDIISKELRVKLPVSQRDRELIEKMSKENSIAVSIRANKAPENPKVKDNLDIGFIDKDYYYRGMQEMAKRIENPVFYIFADDLDIVKSEYEFPFSVNYVTPDDSATGMRLMYSCKHFVIANSTFSWWGAYLGENPNKLIVMPEVFDRQGPPRQDIFIGEPIKLSVNFLTE
jgi:hypothetical protein